MTSLKNSKSFSISELKDLIEHGSKFGIASIKLEGIEITFQQGFQPIGSPPSPEILKAQTRIEKEDLERAESNFKQEALDQMLLEDPVEHEKILIQEDLMNEVRRT